MAHLPTRLNAVSLNRCVCITSNQDKSFLPLLEQVCHGEPASHPSSDGSDAGQPPSGPSLPSGVVSGTPGAVVALDSPGSSSGTNKSSSSFSRKDTPQANPACVGTLKGACRRLYRAALTGEKRVAGPASSLSSSCLFLQHQLPHGHVVVVLHISVSTHVLLLLAL
jgi:hypothetical protein